MQLAAFATGGFVLHRVTSLTTSKISAWFDQDGGLVDAEFPDLGRGVRRNSATWKALGAIGKRMVGTTALTQAQAGAKAALDQRLAA